MPTTARWVVHGVQGRSDCINYIKNKNKTEDGILVTGVNCSSEFAAYEMKMNNDKFHIVEDNDSRTCYHGYQSFDPKEKNLTPEEAHEIGVELVKRLYPDYQVVVSTHTDRSHIHNHFVINAVNMSGKKLEDRLANPIEGLYGLRDISDSIALSHGLKIIEDAPKIGRFHKSKYLYALAQKSWKQQIIEKLEELKTNCFTFDELLENLALDGYLIKTGKNIRIKPYGKQKFVTMKFLGEEYSEENLKKFFLNKSKNSVLLDFVDYKLSDENSELLNIQDILIRMSKKSILSTMKELEPNSKYPKYYNSRYMEIKRYHKLIDTLNFLNDYKIYTHDDLLNNLNELKEEIEIKQKEYEEQVSANETLQLRVPLCNLYLQLVDYYESYLEQKDMINAEIELSNEVKTFMDIKTELGDVSLDDVKHILASANRSKTETNKQYAYLTYLKNKASSLERIKGLSLETEKGYIKSFSISEKMIDQNRTSESKYCIRVPYSNYYIYVPKENVSWFNYNQRANVYVVDDKEYELYDKDNLLVDHITGELLEELSLEEKSKVSEYYRNENEKEREENNE